MARRRKKNAPVCPGRFRVQQLSAEDWITSGRNLAGRAVNHLGRLLARGDWKAAGFLGLGDLADEIDAEQASLKRGGLDRHEVGKLEGPPEGARGGAE